MISYHVKTGLFTVYDSFKDGLYLLGHEPFIEFKVDQLQAIIIKNFNSTLSIDEFFQKDNILKILQKDQAREVLFRKKIQSLLDQGVLVKDERKKKTSVKNLIYTFVNKDKEELRLEYRLLDNNFCRQWYSLLEGQVNTYDSIMNDGLIFCRSMYSYKELKDKLDLIYDGVKKLCFEFEGLFDTSLLIKSYELCHKDLNQLHFIFEETYESPLLANDEVALSLLRDFNMTIHLCEEFISENEGALVEMVFEKSLGPVSLGHEDKSLFSTDLKFGTIYLNYLQIGHSAIGAFECDSNTYPSKQEYFNANHFLCFRPNYTFDQHDELKNWLAKKFKIDLNAENWCLGHIPLAELVSPKLENIEEKLKEFPQMTRIEFESLD